MDGHILKILLIEDNDGDVYLVRRALSTYGIRHELTIAHDGEEALRFLEKAKAENPDAVPEVILLDLNLPRIDGTQVLRWIRSGSLKRTPVLILTSSDSARDRDATMALGADSYFRKPNDLPSFMQLGKVVEETMEYRRRCREPRQAAQ